MMAFLPLIDIFVASYILERVIVIYLGARFLSKNSVLSSLFLENNKNYDDHSKNNLK